MTQEEITALAREYAEERASVMQGSLGTKIQAELVIRFLLRRFCLVEKSKVIDAYKSARKDIIDGNKSRIGGLIAMGGANGALLESLFPEIAKEVEG